MSHPESLSDPIGGSDQSPGCKTKYWDSLLTFSDIGVPNSYNIIKILYTDFKIKLPPEWCLQCHIYSTESHLHIQKLYITLTDQSIDLQ